MKYRFQSCLQFDTVRPFLGSRRIISRNLIALVMSTVIYGCGEGTSEFTEPELGAANAETGKGIQTIEVNDQTPIIDSEAALTASLASVSSVLEVTDASETNELPTESVEAAKEQAPVDEEEKISTAVNEIVTVQLPVDSDVEAAAVTPEKQHVDTTNVEEVENSGEEEAVDTIQSGTVGSNAGESVALGQANPELHPSLGELRIFPGAEGFGVNSAGGRGGAICFVTSLANSGEGTLRHCAEQSGPRMVIFKTGGTIEVSETIKIEDPYISIYGQTAPGDGILIRGALGSTSAPLAVKTHDVLIQHIRVRAGTATGVTCCRDALQIGNDVPGSVYNVVIDHNSFSWGIDEILDVWYDSHDITISNNIVAESLHDNGSNVSGPAGRGMLIGSQGAHSISIHHNYMAHTYQRNPLIKAGGIVDVTNNLVYHWTSRGGANDIVFDGQQVNWVKNKFISMENAPAPFATEILWGDILITRKSDYPVDIYFEGNLGHYRPDDSMPEWTIAHTDWNTPYDPALGYHSVTRFPAAPITEIPASELETVLPATVGATLPKRDVVDQRIFEMYSNGVAFMPNCVSADDRPGDSRCELNAGGWPEMSPGTAPVDTDQDGIPDSWELQYGLNPAVADSLLDANEDGYLNIEDWIHTIGSGSSN